MSVDGFETSRVARLYVLDFGLFQVHSDGRIIGICGFLIESTDGKRVLIDTGFPPDYARDGEMAARRDGLDSFGRVLSLTYANLPAGQLALLGLTLNDIDALILTHSHIDHIGGLADFPDVPVWVASAERALSQPLYFGSAPKMVWPTADYRLVSGDMTFMPGLDILLVPGHAPGQLAFLIELPKVGPVLLTGDAISRPEEVAEGFAGSWNVTQATASAARLLGLARARDAFVIYGHGPAQWPTLRKAPQAYD